MSTKLTLTLDKEIIEKAKKYASEKGRSLSDLVENYFKLITAHEVVLTKLSPKTKKLKGILGVQEPFDYKEVLQEELKKKYNG
ncbi:MAG TPA: DUF6364 family protein [Cytophagales bacterium]|nr:DUF6364 family protein [Cytophagales bacterium]